MAKAASEAVVALMEYLRKEKEIRQSVAKREITEMEARHILINEAHCLLWRAGGNRPME